ncbi:helix-turn-helix domain-containing protein [Negativibacillus massiliensis]|uniref:helix-turn-helix domain-containing protein n=1 Tax=Negativibacillus massiliensis TaxID=1871035 RepID=UPI003AF1FDF5
MTIDYSAVGKRISLIRKNRGMTQEQLAEKAELSNIYISHIENSRSIPSLETLMKLCSALDITPDEILLGTKQDMENYLQSDIQKKLILCTPKERRMVSRFIDLLLEEREEKN